MKRFAFALIAGLALGTAPATASTIVRGACASVSDSAGCLFKGNINSNSGGNANSYVTAQNLYNALVTADRSISLNPLGSTDDDNFRSIGSLTGSGTSSGTWTLDGYLVDFIAVKASNSFVLYQLDKPASSGSWDTFDIPFRKNALDLSHIVFFGDVVTAVPEPGTWALMLVGFGFVGHAMRRKKAKMPHAQAA